MRKVNYHKLQYDFLYQYRGKLLPQHKLCTVRKRKNYNGGVEIKDEKADLLRVESSITLWEARTASPWEEQKLFNKEQARIIPYVSCLADGYLADITIECQGEEFSAHGLILKGTTFTIAFLLIHAPCSNVFKFLSDDSCLCKNAGI